MSKQLKNPYLKKPNALVTSFVCHSDILGYKDFACKSDNSSFLKLKKALENSYIEMVRGKGPFDPEKEDDYAKFEMKTFTDNVVVGYPISKPEWNYGEPELGDLLWLISKLQMSLAREGFFVRGGIAYGECYIDEHIVFGKAFLEALKLDQSSGAPRIVFSKSAKEAIEEHIKCYGSVKQTPHYHDLLKDADGEYFVNYLAESLIAFPDGEIFFDLIDAHKREVEKRLTEYRGKTDVFAKYEWAASYHNFFCKDIARQYPPPGPDADPEQMCKHEHAQKILDYTIDLISFIPTPTRLE